MRIIGLTGGIGVGKSTVAQLFADHGAEIIDVDLLGRQIIAPGGSAVEAVVERFGPQVRAADGSVDRAALAAIVFNDADELAALNAISHPAINAQLDEQLAAIESEQPNATVVLDMAVLAESRLGQGIDHPYEQVVVVEAPLDIRIARLVDRGHSLEDAQARMASQTSDEHRREIADFVIVNDSDLETLAVRVGDVWGQL